MAQLDRRRRVRDPSQFGPAADTKPTAELLDVVAGPEASEAVLLSGSSPQSAHSACFGGLLPWRTRRQMAYVIKPDLHRQNLRRRMPGVVHFPRVRSTGCI